MYFFSSTIVIISIFAGSEVDSCYSIFVFLSIFGVKTCLLFIICWWRFVFIFEKCIDTIFCSISVYICCSDFVVIWGSIFVDICGSIFADGDFPPYLREAELIFAARWC